MKVYELMHLLSQVEAGEEVTISVNLTHSQLSQCCEPTEDNYLVTLTPVDVNIALADIEASI